MASAYCLRCKRRSSTRNVRVITTRNGRNRMTGNCHRCGTRVSKFVGGRQSGRGLHDRIMFWKRLHDQVGGIVRNPRTIWDF